MSAVPKELSQARAPSRRHFAIRAFDAPLGAEVLGLDLSRPLHDEDFARLHRAHSGLSYKEVPSLGSMQR